MKDSEKKLLLFFVGAVLIAGVVILLQFYFQEKKTIESDGDKLALEVVEIDALMEERDLWLARGQWLDENQPKFTSEDQANIPLYRDAGAEGFEGVEIANRRAIAVEETEHFVQVGVDITAKGTLEDVFRWLHHLQHPESFRVVSNLQVQPEKDDDSKIVCKFTLLRWYAPNRNTAENPENT